MNDPIIPLLDLHAHFPMHTRFPPVLTQGPPPVGKEIEYWAANQLLNYQGGQPRVSLADVLAGAQGGLGSVLYDPDDEFFHDDTPLPGAFPNLLGQMTNVEQEVQGKLTIARNPAQVSDCIQNQQRFLFHCVEGAFALGGDPANADVLAARGVAYAVIAHLFYRGVATCQNAFPFVLDPVFQTLLNPQQDSKTGLTPLGTAIVDRLLANGIVVDITHATDLAQNQILDMARDHGNAPVISSHNGLQPISNYPLNLSPQTVLRIRESNGVIGVILFPYWLRQPPDQIIGPKDFSLVFNAIECIHQITGDYDNIAIGTDLDGFIEPVTGCSDYSQTPALVAAIQQKYPQEIAEAILWRNALGVLQRGWKGV